MNIAINQKVSTPLGQGVAQGLFAVLAESGPVVGGVIVRLPINDETRRELSKSNCLTPRAQLSGLWVFDLKDLKGA